MSLQAFVCPRGSTPLSSPRSFLGGTSSTVTGLVQSSVPGSAWKKVATPGQNRGTPSQDRVPPKDMGTPTPYRRVNAC